MLTLLRYRRLGIDAVIDRLLNRHQHLLAFRIAGYMKLRTDKILVHWACERVKVQDDDDNTTCNAIVEKLRGHPGISFAEVAETAYHMGKPELATSLLEQEPNAKQQVPLLIKINQDELALVKALESGDTDLAYHVLLLMHRKLPTGEFFRIIHDKPLACSLFEVYCRKQVRPDALRTLKDYFDHDDRRMESAGVYVLEAYAATSLSVRIRVLKQAQNLFNDDREGAFAARVNEDEIKLLMFQEEIENETHDKFVDLSLAQTVHKLFMKVCRRLLRMIGAKMCV